MFVILHISDPTAGIPKGLALLFFGLIVVSVLNKLKVHFDEVLPISLLELVAAVKHHLSNVRKFPT
jgi:hypothetical protein